MSKSLEYCKIKYKNKNDFSNAKEIDATQYFDKIMKGERIQIKNFENGKIKIEFKFDKDAEFNFVDAFGGVRHMFIDDQEEQIDHCVEATLCENAFVPFTEDKKEPIGGWPQPGDRLMVVFGNIILINNIKIENGNIEQEMYVFIPKFYKRIPGGLNE